MKAIQYILRAGIACFGAVVALTSCNKDPEYFSLTTYPDQMHVSSSVSSITLSKAHSTEEALTLSWDKITSPVSADDKITYKVCFFPSTDRDNKSDYIETTDNKLTFTHNELNSIVARFALAGEEIRLTAQVLGVVENELKYVKPMQSTVDFNVIGYEKYPQYLYLHMIDGNGTAKPEVKMEQRQLGTGVYEVYLDNLTACDYYFTTVSQQAFPAYEMAADGKLQFVEDGDATAPTYSMFTNTQTGKRTIIVDLDERYYDCRVVDFVQLPTASSMWIVGDATSIGWPDGDPTTAVGKFEFVGSAREPWLYSWTGEFTADKEFKIALTNSYSGQFLYAPEQDADPAENHTLGEPRNENGMDYKWKPKASGRYTFTVSLLRSNMYTSFVPAE